MQAATYRKTGLRAAVFVGLLCLTAGVLFTAMHTGNLAKLLSVAGGWFAGDEAAASAPTQKPRTAASEDESGWGDFMAGGKNFSNGISQVVPAAKKTAAQALAAVDNVVHGTPSAHYGGSYSFHQSVGFVPGYPGWVDEGGGGGGCYGSHCGGGDGDCHRTNTCGGGDDCHVTNTCGGGDDCHKTNTCGGGDDCHVTNTCGGGDDCHKTNTCGCEGPTCNPHDVAEPESMPLLAAGLVTFAARVRRRKARARGGCGAVPGSR